LSTNVNNESDLMLLALLKQGNNQAFENIYNKYWYGLFKTAHKRLHDREKCQDVVQNIFTDLWNRRAEVEIRDLQAYLHSAARFQVLKAVTRQSGQITFIDVFETEIISSLHADGSLLDKEAKKLVEQFINALPSKRRTIFIKHYIDELTTAQIASELNVSQKTVQNQLTTASHALRLRLTHLFSLAALLTTMYQR